MSDPIVKLEPTTVGWGAPEPLEVEKRYDVNTGLMHFSYASDGYNVKEVALNAEGGVYSVNGRTLETPQSMKDFLRTAEISPELAGAIRNFSRSAHRKANTTGPSFSR